MKKDVKRMHQKAILELGHELFVTFRRKNKLFGEKIDTPSKAMKVANQIVQADPLFDKLDQKTTSRLRRSNKRKEKKRAQNPSYKQNNLKTVEYQIAMRKIRKANGDVWKNIDYSEDIQDKFDHDNVAS